MTRFGGPFVKVGDQGLSGNREDYHENNPSTALLFALHVRWHR